MPRYLNDLDVFYDPSQQHSFSPAFDEGAPAAINASAVTLILSSSTGVSGTLNPTYGLSTGSLDTSAIDAFTQGVELSQLKRHDAGLVKVWSGEPGHEMQVTWYGEAGPGITDPYSDDATSYFTDPSSIVKTNPVFPVLVFPIQAAAQNTNLRTLRYETKNFTRGAAKTKTYRTDQDVAGIILNGIIEPLVIRMQPSFYSSDVPVDPHSVGGSAGVGNQDVNQSSDQVVTVDYYDPLLQQVPFIDSEVNPDRFDFVDARINVTGSFYGKYVSGSLVALFYPSIVDAAVAPLTATLVFPTTSGSFLVSGSSVMSGFGTYLTSGSFAFHSSEFAAEVLDTLLTASTETMISPTQGLISFDAPVGAFVDARYVRNVPAPSSESGALLNALSLMTGSTANYVSHNQRSATCGWWYDSNVAVGTDSLAFGGMTH